MLSMIYIHAFHAIFMLSMHPHSYQSYPPFSREICSISQVGFGVFVVSDSPGPAAHDGPPSQGPKRHLGR